jgi:hypothetical protein
VATRSHRLVSRHSGGVVRRTQGFFRGGLAKNFRIYTTEALVQKYGEEGAIQAASRTNPAINSGAGGMIAGAANALLGLPDCGPQQ